MADFEVGKIPRPEEDRLQGDIVTACLSKAQVILDGAPAGRRIDEPGLQGVHILTNSGFAYVEQTTFSGSEDIVDQSQSKYTVRWYDLITRRDTSVEIVAPHSNLQEAFAQVTLHNDRREMNVLTGDTLANTVALATKKLETGRPVREDYALKHTQNRPLDRIGGLEAKEVWGSLIWGVGHLRERVADDLLMSGYTSNLYKLDTRQRTVTLPIDSVHITHEERRGHVARSVVRVAFRKGMMIPVNLQDRSEKFLEVVVSRSSLDTDQARTTRTSVAYFVAERIAGMFGEVVENTSIPCSPDQRKKLHKAIAVQINPFNFTENKIPSDNENEES